MGDIVKSKIYMKLWKVKIGGQRIGFVITSVIHEGRGNFFSQIHFKGD